MIPVEQTRFGKGGNCHAACIASILEVPLDEVPQVKLEESRDDTGWAFYLKRLRRDFLHPRNLHDLSFLAHEVDGGLYLPLGYTILCATSPRTGGLHSVVALDGEIVWDPHPEREDGVGEWHDWTLFVVLDPSLPVNQETPCYATSPKETDPELIRANKALEYAVGRIREAQERNEE